MVSQEDKAEFLGNIIDIFEDFLEKKGIDIPNEEKPGLESDAIIYGTDYGNLQSELEELLIAWNIMNKKGEKTMFNKIMFENLDNEVMKDLLESLDMNGYNYGYDEKHQLLFVHEEERAYVKTMMDDRHMQWIDVSMEEM